MKSTLLTPGCMLLALALASAVTAAPPPSVLFYGFAPHASYIVQPLKALQVEVGTIPAGKLIETLADTPAHVVVVSTLTDAERTAVDAFLEKGGGVLACNPSWHPRVEDFEKTCRWLAGHGATPRWEMINDSNPSNIVSVTFGQLSWSDQVFPPVNAGVRGLLTVISRSTTGWEPPMSYDFSADWTVTVRGAASLRTIIDKRSDPTLQAWIPANETPASPPLMGVRTAGKGRLAVLPFRTSWIFAPPPNCPPVDAMLRHDGDRPSDWLGLIANTVRWLAEPSLKAGRPGITTPPDLLNPPVQAWDLPAVKDWAATTPIADDPDIPQHAGLIGARTALSSGSGTVADYAKAAKDAGLSFIVFFEDSLKMEQAAWDQLVRECTAATDDTFVAVPGLSYEDAQGNHLYVLGDKVMLARPDMRLPDRRLNTAKPNRCDMYFRYINELIGQDAMTGFWRHRENQIHWRDYKLYNSFPIVSFVDGKPVDDALPEYLDWMGMGGCQAVMAFEVLSSPDRVKERAAKGWRVVWNRSLDDLRTGQWFRGAYSFSGMGAQYITSGPSIRLWSTPNSLVGANGLWWRPDLWEFRVRLRVASDAGIRSIVLHDGNRQVLRRWLPGGEKRVEKELILANAQQLGLTLVVDDVNGGRAVSTGYWNRNLNQEEFFCSDRCNILGSARLRIKRNGAQHWTPVGFQGNMGCTPSKGRMNIFAQPSVGLTGNAPTIPVDGQPHGLTPVTLNLNIGVPGEIAHLFTTPATYLASPEMVVGQYGFDLAYDPAEEKAETSPLGHAYEPPQQGHGNSWSSWHRLVPTRKLQGWGRMTACNWLTEGFRIGWFEMKSALRETVTPDAKGIPIGYTQGILYRDGKPLTGRGVPPSTLPFDRGTFACMESDAGATVVIGMGPGVDVAANGETLNFYYGKGAAELPAGAPIEYTIAFAGADGHTSLADMLAFAQAFGITTPGRTAYQPAIRRGRILDTYLALRLEAADGSIDMTIPKTALPGFLPVEIRALNDLWSVTLLDRARPFPNHRALPIRDGSAWAQLDTHDGDLDLFIGHPVTSDNPAVRIQVSWMEAGSWWVEAHNPSDAPLKTRLRSSPGWTPFAFDETLDLPAGSSGTWIVKE